jgi:hypothetical protein
MHVPMGGDAPSMIAAEACSRHTHHGPSSIPASPFGSGSLGFTPYFFCRARPHGQPPNVITVSMAWRKRARRFPFLALVQTGQRFSQKSGSNQPRSEPLILVVLV